MFGGDSRSSNQQFRPFVYRSGFRELLLVWRPGLTKRLAGHHQMTQEFVRPWRPVGNEGCTHSYTRLVVIVHIVFACTRSQFLITYMTW